MEFGVRDVQRIWLEITAMLDYMEIFKPKMDGLLGNRPPAQTQPDHGHQGPSEDYFPLTIPWPPVV
jgi:hypothetical protein